MQQTNSADSLRSTPGKEFYASIYRRLFIGLLFAVTTSSTLLASGISVSESFFVITGEWNETWNASPGILTNNSGVFSWASLDGAPLTGSVTSPHGWNEASGTISSFSLAMDAFSSATGGPSLGSPQAGTYMTIQVNAKTLFHSEATDLSISLSGYSRYNKRDDEQIMQLTLRDTTISSTLLAISEGWGMFKGAPSLREFPLNGLDPSHEYELELSGWIYAYDAKMADLGAEVQITSIPEPGAVTLVLLGAITLFAANRGGKSR